jgi:hypothetical protein
LLERLKLHPANIPAAILIAALLSGCSGSLQAPSLPSVTGSTALISTTHAQTINRPPRSVYEQIARHAAKCWFGPFGSAHNRFMTSAKVPPPTSPDPVTMIVHRRLSDLKNPWGTTLMRLELNGRATTTLSYSNVGLDAATYSSMKNGLTNWANGQTHCPDLHGSPPPATVAEDAIPPRPTQKRRR